MDEFLLKASQSGLIPSVGDGNLIRYWGWLGIEWVFCFCLFGFLLYWSATFLLQWSHQTQTRSRPRGIRGTWVQVSERERLCQEAKNLDFISSKVFFWIRSYLSKHSRGRGGRLSFSLGRWKIFWDGWWWRLCRSVDTPTAARHSKGLARRILCYVYFSTQKKDNLSIIK